MEKLYERIEKLCSDTGVSVTYLCTEAGVSRTNLSELKAGRTKVLSTTALVKIADYFDVSIDFLLGRAVKPVAAVPEDLLIVWKMFDGLNYRGKAKLTEYIDDLTLIDKYKKESA